MLNLTKLTNKKLNTKSNPQDQTEAIQIAMPFVLKGAKRWTRNHHSYMDDFIMSGIEGALEAYNRFKGTEYEQKGYLYSSFSYFWIRAKQQELAVKTWKFMNNTQSMPEDWQGNTGDDYSINEDFIDTKRQFEKLTPDQQKLVQMKTEGYTFDEIANELNFKSLHQARNEYLRQQKKLVTQE